MFEIVVIFAAVELNDIKLNATTAVKMIFSKLVNLYFFASQMVYPILKSNQIHFKTNVRNIDLLLQYLKHYLLNLDLLRLLNYFDLCIKPYYYYVLKTSALQSLIQYYSKF